MVQGVPATVVIETGGHSQIGLTRDTYGHVSSELQGQAGGRVAAARGWAARCGVSRLGARGRPGSMVYSFDISH